MMNFDQQNVTPLDGTAYQVLRATNKPWGVLLGPRGSATPVKPAACYPLIWIPSRRGGPALRWFSPFGREGLRSLKDEEAAQRFVAMTLLPHLQHRIADADDTADLDGILDALQQVEAAASAAQLDSGRTDLYRKVW